jgi:hypothetical protein
MAIRTMRSQLCFLFLLALLAQLFLQTNALVGPAVQLSRQAPNARSSALYIGNLFGGLFGQQKEEKEESGSNALLDMPSTVKVGPLKFFVQLYLVGQQNNPSKKSWTLNSNDETDSIDMYYTDATAMFSVVIKEDGIKVERRGMKPSLQYALQESVMLHGLLDELSGIAEVEDVEPEKRLIQFNDLDAVAKAREGLPARKA